jgi:hypothetical protein
LFCQTRQTCVCLCVCDRSDRRYLLFIVFVGEMLPKFSCQPFCSVCTSVLNRTPPRSDRDGAPVLPIVIMISHLIPIPKSLSMSSTSPGSTHAEVGHLNLTLLRSLSPLLHDQPGYKSLQSCAHSYKEKNIYISHGYPI